MTEIQKTMTISEECAYWAGLLSDIQNTGMTIEKIAEHVGVLDRQVWRWKAGEGRPKGMNAIKVYTLHARLCPSRHCQVGQLQVPAEGQ